MRELSSTFRQAVYEGNRNYQCRAEITLLDDTELEITNANIMLGGIEIFDSVTSDNSFDALGSVIINALSITLDNSSDTYSQYDFYGASVVFYMGLEDIEEICIGTYTIDDTSYNNATIVLYCLDNMVKFDKPYSDSSLTYPATLYTIVADICTVCGVTLDSDYSQFPHYNYTISTRPDDIALTCREVLSFVVSMCGCFAKCNSDGELQIKWFNTSELTIAGIDGGIFDSSTPYATGDSVNGGTMSPWSTGDIADGGTFTDVNGLHYISALASQTIATDDVTITGVKITIQNQVVDADSADEPIIDYLSGTADYTVSISNNPFLTADNAQTVANWLATDLVGLTFRPLSITHLDDLSIEAGDVALVLDRKGNIYKTLITNVLFKINSYETSKCSAESIPKKAGTRYSVEEKNYAITKELVEKASTTATRYITDITNGIFVSPEGQGPNDTQTPTGWRIKDALELLKTGVSYIWAGLVNNIATVRVGKEAGGHSVIDESGMRVYGGDGSTQLANIGYGEGNAQSGTAEAPYYTFGTRATGSAVGNWSVVEGRNNTASGFGSHAEGARTTASGSSSHAEGEDTVAAGTYSHAEGMGTSTASGMGAQCAHAEGRGTQAKGRYSHAEGYETLVKTGADAGHAGGIGTIVEGEAQTAIGKYNVADTSSLFIVGKGTSDSARSNAFKVEDTGDVVCAGRCESNDWTGTRRTPVSSISGDGLRVGYMKGTSSTNLVVCAQWGTAGGAFSEKNVTVSSSDIRLKKNVEDCEVEDALSVINRIKMHSFDWLHTDEHQRIGFIADELEEIDPKLSVGGGTERDGTINYKSVDTFYMMGYLVKAIQEQQKQIQQLQAEIAELKKGGTQ